MIKKENGKFYLSDSFVGNMMIYGAKSESPYVKRFGMKFELSEEQKAELKALA